MRKPSVSDDFWSTSTCDLDNSTVQSQRSISSISTSNQTLNCGSGIGSMSSNSDFVNNGKFSSLCYPLFSAYVLRNCGSSYMVPSGDFYDPLFVSHVHVYGFLAGTSLVPWFSAILVCETVI